VGGGEAAQVMRSSALPPPLEINKVRYAQPGVRCVHT